MPNTDTAARPKFNYSIVILILGVVAAAITTYGYFYLPFIPRHYDQTIAILNFYDGYYTWKDSAAPLGGFLHSLITQQTFKGGLSQAVGLMTSVILGPSRYALLVANLLALMLFLTAVYSFAAKRLSVAISSVLAALCLMGNAIYMPAGGIFDLRWDFVGIMVFSCYVLFLAMFVHSNTRASLVSLIVFAFLAINVRSITAVFIGATLMVVFLVYCLLAINKTWRLYALGRLRSLVLVGVITGGFYAIFGFLFWNHIDAYYLNHLRTGEDVVRLKEFGAQSGLFNYYVTTALALHKGYFAYAIPILGILWAMWGFNRLRSFRHENPDPQGVSNATTDPLNVRWRIEGVMIAIVSTLAVLIPVSMFSPSPIMPAYMTGACVLLTICVVPPMRIDEGWSHYWWLMAVLVAFGMLRIGSMQSWSKPELTSHGQLTKLYDLVVRDHPNGGLLYFSVIDEAVLPSAFWIWLYESGNREKRNQFSAKSVEILPLSLDAYVADLTAADAIFKWELIEPKPTYYPAEDQLRGDFGKLAWSKVSAQFSQRQTISYKNGILGYYKKKARLTRLTAPFGIAEDWFWLGDQNATMTVTSEGASDAHVAAKVWRGPSLPNESKINICLTQDGQNKNCFLIEPAVLEVQFPVTLISGANSMQLSVSLPNKVIPLPVPNDPRILWLRVSNIQIRGKQP